MKNISDAVDRGKTADLHRSSYETVFSVFMAAVVFFYRGNAQIVYPDILYCFLLLLASNFTFTLLMRKKQSVSLWAVDLLLAFNLLVITGVVYYSGGSESYFWVLYLLPVFAVALAAGLKDVAGVVFLCALSAAAFSWPVIFSDVTAAVSLAVKLCVFTLSGTVVYRTAAAGKQAEKALALKRREVEAMSRELTAKETEMVMTASAGEVGQLAEGLMHDLANSVCVILTSAQIAVQEEHIDRNDIECIIKAARFAKELLANTLNIARGRDYVFAPGDIREQVKNSIQFLGYAANKKGVSISVELSPDLPKLSVSKVHIERLFMNLVSNALDFSPHGGEVKVKVARSGDGIEIGVSDSGPGFPEILLRDGIKAFRTTRKETGGTGLGLYVCAQIAARHGGRIHLSNNPSGGAAVNVTLPALVEA